MYGGRVIDNYDQRIVNTFMEEYFGEFMVDEFQRFYFYHDQETNYILPEDGEKEDYLSIILLGWDVQYMIEVQPSNLTRILFTRRRNRGTTFKQRSRCTWSTFQRRGGLFYKSRKRNMVQFN